MTRTTAPKAATSSPELCAHCPSRATHICFERGNGFERFRYCCEELLEAAGVPEQQGE